MATVEKAASGITPGDDYVDYQEGATELQIGLEQAGRLESDYDQDTFAIPVQAGVSYHVHATGQSDEGGAQAAPALDVTPPIGLGGYAYGIGDLDFTAAGNGAYYVTVHHGPGVIASMGYQLMVALALDDYAGNNTTAGSLPTGGTVAGTLESPLDEDWFKITLLPKQAYAFILNSSSERSNFKLYDANGKDIDLHASGRGDGSSVLTVSSTLGGDYYLGVTDSYYSGSYTLRSEIIPPDDISADRNTSATLPIGGTLSATAYLARDVDWVKVSLLAGQGYTFGLHATYSNGQRAAMSELKLVDAEGKVVQYTANSPAGRTDQLLSYQAKASGDYYLVVGGNSATFNVGYTLTSYSQQGDAQAADSSTTALLEHGKATRAAIDYAGDRDWFKVDLKQGVPYEFRVSALGTQGGTLDTTDGILELVLMGADGTVYSEASIRGFSTSRNEMDATVERSGTYYLQVSTGSTNTGSYSLTIYGEQNGADIQAPELFSLNAPFQNSHRDPDDWDAITLIFNEPVQLREGTVTLSIDGGATVATFSTANHTLEVIYGTHVKLVGAPVLLPNTTYKLVVSAGLVSDKDGNVTLVDSISGGLTYPYRDGGTDGNDVFYAAQRHDGVFSYNGGAGTDTVVFAGKSNEYFVSAGRVGHLGEYGLTFKSVERMQFDDATVAFDQGGTLPELYQLYRAAFDRKPDEGGLGYWLARAEKNVSMQEIAESFINSTEFSNLYGKSSGNGDFITHLYQNVLHRMPDQGGFDYWSQIIEHGVLSRAQVLLSFSNSPENSAAVHAEIVAGMRYIPYI
ncbi:DUF4214 domain-containing protein [Oxalobacteraceae bacterium A2-2]